jgi:NitT/TauT family transport system permease protein
MIESNAIQPASSAKVKAARPLRLRLGQWLRRYGVTLGAVVLFFVAWELIIVIFGVKRYILPRPSEILRTYFDPKLTLIILESTLITTGEALLGFAVAVLLGVPLSMLITFSRLLSKTIYPFAVALEMVPKIAFAPLFITWFGFGIAPKIVVVFMVCFFPIMLNGVLAFRSLNPDIIYFSQSTGANSWTMFRKIRLPAALPQIFNGLKGAATNATVGAVIAEWIGSDAGLGFYLNMFQGQLRTEVGFALIFILAVIGLALFYAVVLAEKLIVPWHVSQRIGGQISRS